MSETPKQTEFEKIQDTKAVLDGISKSACGAKWFQTTLHLFNGNTQSCHHVRSHKVDQKSLLSEPGRLHNTDQKIKARQGLLNGKQIAECNYCWNIENVSGVSDRHIKSSQDWSRPGLIKNNLESQLRSVVPTYVEVAFDNLCNLKCMYCSPVYSSSWESEIRRFGPYPTSRRYNNLTLFQIQKTSRLKDEALQLYKDAFWNWWPSLRPSLQHLRVTGGEPLMSADLWKLLDELKNSPPSNLIFSVNTNLMLPETKFAKLIENLNEVQKKTEKIILFTSIDSVGAQAEYLRFGLNEDLFYKNLKSILDQTHESIKISFMITVSALSISGLPHLLKKIFELQQEYPHRDIDFDTPYLNRPHHLSVRILPKTFDSYLDESIEILKSCGQSDLQIEKIKRIKDHMIGNRFSGPAQFRLRRDFKRMMSEHDKRRGTDFYKTFPEYTDFLKSIWDPKWVPNI